MNQPIDEKWKLDYKKDFVSGDAYTQHPQKTINFIENLLEQEKRKISEAVKEKQKTVRMEQFTVDTILSIINK